MNRHLPYRHQFKSPISQFAPSRTSASRPKGAGSPSVQVLAWAAPGSRRRGV